MKIRYYLLATGALLLNAYCRGDFNPPEVTGTFPTQNATGIANNVEVWVEFSESMDTSQTETAFSLFADSDRPKGQFIWQGNKLTFIPRAPLTTGKVYTMLVSKSAEDSLGNNLRDDYQVNFTVNPDAGKPYIVSNTPVYGQTGVLPTDVLTFVFSEAINPSTLIPGTTITPSVIGDFTVNAAGDTVTFTPQSNLLNGTVYTVNINTNIQDLSGNPLLQGRTISFVVGTDFIRPTITSAINTKVLPLPVVTVPLSNGFLVTGASRSGDIIITFDELMNTSTLTNAFTISPTAGFSKTFATVGVSTQATLRFSPPLESDTLYTLSVSNSATDIANNILNQNYNFQFRTDAPDSIRPVVDRVRHALTTTGICSLNVGNICQYACIPAADGICSGQTLNGAETADLVQNQTLTVSEQIDIDASATTATFRIVLNVHFSKPMHLPSLMLATTYTPIVSGPGVVNVTGIQLDGTGTIMSVYISGWQGLGYHKLKIAGGVAKDMDNNFLLNDFVFFHN